MSNFMVYAAVDSRYIVQHIIAKDSRGQYKNVFCNTSGGGWWYACILDIWVFYRLV